DRQIYWLEPVSAYYLDYSVQFMTTAGTHVLKFVGTNSQGGDNTAFIDNVRITASADYQLNPRPAETNIYDASNNHGRVTYGYYTYQRPSGAACSLLTDTYEYGSSGESVGEK